MKVGVIGLGLIGGSIAWDLRSQLMVHVTGYDISASHQEQALNRSLVDQIKDLETLVYESDVIILAIPVHHIASLLPGLLDKIRDGQIIIDLGSTKSNIAKEVLNHPSRGKYIAAHPLAGTEFSGPQAALRNLFNGKKNIICDRELSDKAAIEITISIFESLGMKTYFMSSEDHDKHLAYVSHLSHISSFTLGLTVLDIEKDEKTILDLAGTGLRSTVRLAASASGTWTPIFNTNKSHLLTALDQYMLRLSQFRDALKMNDTESLNALIDESNSIAKILN